MARVLEIETAVAWHEMLLEVARLGSSVNGVCPGQVETDAPAGKRGKEKQAAVQRTPMWLFGQPEEISKAVRFLACAEAGYITGCALQIDGGIF